MLYGVCGVCVMCGVWCVVWVSCVWYGWCMCGVGGVCGGCGVCGVCALGFRRITMRDVRVPNGKMDIFVVLCPSNISSHTRKGINL